MRELDAKPNAEPNVALHPKSHAAHHRPNARSSALIIFVGTLRKNEPQKDDLADYVCTAHVMPMDGEDIKVIFGALQNIERAVEKFAERVDLVPQQTQALRT